MLPGAAFAILYLLGCNNALVVVLLVFAVAAQAFGMPGFYVNHLDLAPPFAGLFTPQSLVHNDQNVR